MDFDNLGFREIPPRVPSMDTKLYDRLAAYLWELQSAVDIAMSHQKGVVGSLIKAGFRLHLDNLYRSFDGPEEHLLPGMTETIDWPLIQINTLFGQLLAAQEGGLVGGQDMHALTAELNLIVELVIGEIKRLTSQVEVKIETFLSCKHLVDTLDAVLNTATILRLTTLV